jgi:hypothetical protein
MPNRTSYFLICIGRCHVEYILERIFSTVPQFQWRSGDKYLSIFSKINIISVTHGIGLFCSQLFVPQIKNFQSLSSQTQELYAYRKKSGAFVVLNSNLEVITWETNSG